MKNRNTVNWIRGITLGIAATALVLLTYDNNAQTESVVKGGRTVEIKTGENYTLPLSEKVSLDMIWIEPGTFMMGSPESESSKFAPNGYSGFKKPETQHRVTLTKGYWLGKYEVTQEQYKAIMGNDPSKFAGDNLPVEQVSWDDAMEFCRKLTDRLGDTLPKGYKCSLPTEAQWEYACRAGTTSSLNSGKNVTTAEKGEKGVCDNLDEVGWYWMNGGMKNWNEGKNSLICTHSVGMKKPNAWGLYDMHGNVYEWCLDWVAVYPSGSVTDPKGPSTGVYRVLRGGGWGTDPRYCRSASRCWDSPDDRVDGIGFRLALVPIQYDSVQTSAQTKSVAKPVRTVEIKTGENYTLPLSEKVSLDMIWIAPGTFMMGSPTNELGRQKNEIQHEVTLTKGYWLGKYEVTQEQYKAIMGNNPSKFEGNNLPVEQVSWDDAMEFCKKLTEVEKEAGRLPEGYEYNLPTEAQWEYACRAGVTTALNSGKELISVYGMCPNLDEVGWYTYNSDRSTHPVGQKKPNAWGLYDTHGNVWEWCLDWYGDYPTSSVTDPNGTSNESVRVVRGGSWYYFAGGCRSASRGAGPTDCRDCHIGFRVALISIQYNSVQTSVQTESVAKPVRTVEIKAGKNYTLPLSEKVSLDMIWIAPGTFMMGSPTDELGRSESYDETQHEVTLTRGYWLGKYEITQEQYRVIMDENPSMWQGENLPVEMVSWNDAKKFCEKLTVIEKKAGRLMKGYEYTLPTEAQWEYACRAETVTAFNNGKNIPAENQKIVNPCPNLDLVAWYWFNSDYKTHSVGQKEPNAWGLYDMHGNVWEWCLDGYGDYQTSPATDPVGPTNFQRVTRGGSYFNHAYDCRSADRLYHHPSKSGYNFLGFRVALAPILYDSEQTKSVTEPIETVEIKAGMSYTLPLSEDVNLDMIWIESGTFMMGSPTNELGRDDDEIQHKVTLTQGYWLGKYEVTQSQYETVMGTNPSDRTGYDGEYYGVGDNYPVYYVSWFDAMKFCKELTKIEKEAERLPEGYEYILPTEAQWEYACRAGTTTVFNNGKNIPTWEQRVSNPCPNLDEVGWYCYNSRGKTHPVGRKQPNAWGLYDMHGNVEEWCLNWYDDYPTSPVTDPMGPALREVRIIRSGSWGNSAGCCRSAMRGGCTPDTVWEYGGFRVALAPIQYNSVQTKSVTEPIETVEIKAGESYTLPLSEEVNLDMIWIEPGTFIMGSSENELGRDDNEIQHEVTLTQGYWLGKYEVTQSQYEIVMETNPSEFRGDDLPVDSVSWNHAKRFCVKLTAIEKEAGRLPEGYEYTLPTEAQWEYACRAGTTTALNNGKNISTKEQTMKEPCPEMNEVGWYTHNSDRSTHLVGQKQANAWGLYDMHGNVEEWCLDRYGDYPTSTVTDPMGPSTGEYHVLRGGCYGRLAVYCRSAFRSGKAPNISGYNGYYSNGFRLALVPVQ